MEATQVDVSNGLEDGAVSFGPDDQLIEASAAVGPTANPSSVLCSEEMVASFENKKQSNPGDQHLQASSLHPGTSFDPTVHIPTSSPGVSNCYVFKSRLQEYAQRVGFPTPVYETIREGPSHEPSFRSTVIVGGTRYESLPGFFNRKAAEQSAAEVALMELSKSGDKKDYIAVPVHETGLCKNLLQEYAQKMNYAIPTYICRKDDTLGRTPLFSCTVDIGGIQYIGAAARTKKEAEIKAARTALLAIRSSGTVGGQNPDGKPQYTVVPGKRKIPETAPPQVETAKVKKQKKPRFKKKRVKQMQPCDQAGMLGVLVSNDTSTPTAIQQFENCSSDVQAPNHGQRPDCLASSDQDSGPLKSNQLNGEASVVTDASAPLVGMVESTQTQADASSCQQDVSRNHDVGDLISMTNALPSVQSDAVIPDSAAVSDANHAREENHDQGGCEITPMIDAPLSGQSPTDSGISQVEAATAVVDRFHVEGENIVWVGKVLQG